jgi:D-alanyl-D-alanine carboxypeptidase
MNLSSLRACAVLALALLGACGGGGGGGGGDNALATTVATQTFRVADLPETSTGAAGFSHAANPQIDQAVQAALKQYHLPGATVVVMKDQQVVYAKGYGYANLATRAPAKPEHRFQIGSISKSFVATAIMLLAEDGKLSLDDPVSKHVGGLPEAWRGTTIRHLLNHTSGLPHDTTADVKSKFERFMAASDVERIGMIATIPLLSTPGAKYEYSNLGYTVAGLLANTIAGIDHVELLQQRVFRPLGMTVRRVDAGDAVDALGYHQEGDTLREISNSPGENRFWALGAGGLAMSALDLAKWDAALYGTQVLQAASLAEVSKPQVTLGNASWYGLGWFLQTVTGHFLMRHHGSMSGYESDYRRFPGARFSTVVLTNSGNVLQSIPGAQHIARLITEQFHPELAVK